MQVFTSEELQRRPSDVQQSALVEPTIITFHGRPRLVMMSLDEFDRLQGRRHLVMDSADFSPSVLAEMQRIAHEYDEYDGDLELLGGLLDEDDASKGPGFR